MAASDLAFRFTEEKYASLSEVKKDLKTSLVDHIWQNIIGYREQYNLPLGIHSFAKNEYVLCNCQFIISKNAQNEMRLLRIMKETSNLVDDDYTNLEFASNINLLKYVAKANELDNSEIRMRAILRNEVRSLDDHNLVLPRYIRALNHIKRHVSDDIDLNLIKTLAKFLNNSDDVSLRDKNDLNRDSKAVVDRIYTSAPVALIEPLLDELFAFIANSNINPLIKAYIVYYFIVMIKPFDAYSNEIALLTSKMIIARESMGEIATLLPLEELLVNTKEEDIQRIFVDVQKYNDVTYFVRYGLDFNNLIANKYLDFLVSFKSNAIKEEFYAVDEPLVSFDEPKKEEVKEVIKPKVEAVEIKEVAPEIAISVLPTQIDEKEAARLEAHLLELDPSLKKGEAHFYARHCTLGKSYTIAQFKKYNGVAYETARTSMDHLAELGYYRKEQIKNKFVYCPIKR